MQDVTQSKVKADRKLSGTVSRAGCKPIHLYHLATASVVRCKSIHLHHDHTVPIPISMRQTQTYVYVFSSQIATVVLYIVESKSHTKDTTAKYNYAIQLLNHSIRLCHDNTFFFVLHRTTNRQLQNVVTISSPLPQYSHIRHYRLYCSYCTCRITTGFYQ